MLMTGSCWPGAPTQGQRSGLHTRPAPACLARMHSVALSTARLDNTRHATSPTFPQQGGHVVTVAGGMSSECLSSPARLNTTVLISSRFSIPAATAAGMSPVWLAF